MVLQIKNVNKATRTKREMLKLFSGASLETHGACENLRTSRAGGRKVGCYSIPYPLLESLSGISTRVSMSKMGDQQPEFSYYQIGGFRPNVTLKGCSPTFFPELMRHYSNEL